MGGGSSTRSNKPRRAGEMTYHECVMAGNAIRARKNAIKEHKATLEHRAENLKNFETTMAKLSAAMKNFTQVMSNNFITKPIAFVFKNAAIPIVNFIQNIPRIFININNLKFEIADKLNAIFGEAKAFVEKKISEFVSVIKTKFKSIFKVFKKNNTEDEDTKIDDEKRIFNLKTILHKILRKNKKDEQNSTNK